MSASRFALAPALDEKVPPNSPEAEMSALGAMLLSERGAVEATQILREDDFYYPSHTEIYRAILQLQRSGKPVDLVTLRIELEQRGTLEEVGGVAYLLEIGEAVPSATNAEYYASIVQDLATLRRLETAGREIQSLVHDPELDAEEKVDTAEDMVFRVGERRVSKYFSSVKSLAKDFFTDVDHLFETQEPILGTQTGFTDLDNLTTGFYPGDLVIIAARPAMGKSSLALNMALNVARERKGNVAVFSLEMTGAQLVRRIVSTISRVSMATLKKANLTSENFHRLTDGCEELYDLPIMIDDSSECTPVEMRLKCRRLKADGGLALIVVDYLQLMRGSNRRIENRTQEISEIARGLKGMAKDLNVPVIALAQLNRGVENRPDKRPMLSDIRESGSIEAEADMVMFIYRDEYYRRKEAPPEAGWNPDAAEVAELIIGKHRNGPTGTVLLGFQPAYTRFTLLDDSSKSEYMRRLRSQNSDE
ncbi:MAG: replicative DNA helicase [Fimbriimonadaceae bacterium]|nr:replicative DNA helicase [Fimbriimonadaceae bacterium]QYK54746.1 MAG: replicative DNA helicase [Fimbriimonadaceae bacterium]